MKIKELLVKEGAANPSLKTIPRQQNNLVREN